MKKRSSGVIAIRSLLALTLLCGGIYPALITVLAHTFRSSSAAGSMLFSQGRPAGSKWLAQNSTADRYFHSRPSAGGYNTMPGAASNLSLASAAFRDSVSARRVRFLRENGLPDSTAVPTEMLCSSASGLDPHISPAAARLQMERVALARQLDAQQRQQLHMRVEQAVEDRQWGFLGEPRVNVLLLNYQLDNPIGFDTFKQALAPLSGR